MTWRKVAVVTFRMRPTRPVGSRPGMTAVRVIDLELTCGHKQTRRGAYQRPPRKVLCKECT